MKLLKNIYDTAMKWFCFLLNERSKKFQVIANYEFLRCIYFNLLVLFFWLLW